MTRLDSTVDRWIPIGTAPVAIVTGGAGDLGSACVQALAERGMTVAVVDRIAPTQLDTSDGRPPHYFSADVTSPDEVAAVHQEIENSLGVVSVLVNAAGVARSTRFDAITVEEWNQVLAVSVTGTFLLTRACVPGMRRIGYGRVVNFSSTAGKNVSTLAGVHYTAAKAGVLGLTRALAKELGPAGITVNAVCPGLFETRMARTLAGDRDLDAYISGLPVPRIGQPREVGDLVAFLASEGAAYITGAAVDINGGELMV